jgi:hypothetical protein
MLEFRGILISLCIDALSSSEPRSLFTPFPTDPRRHARAATIEIVAVGIIVIPAMWTTVAASITTAREAAMDRTRSEGVNLAAAFADELTHILGGVAGGMEIIAQRMRIAHGAFDIHAWARVIPLLSNATIQAGIIGPDGWLVSTTLAPAPEPIDLWEFLSPRAREGQCLPAWVRRAAHWQGRAASAVCKKSEWLRRRGLSLLIPGDAAGFSVVCYKSTPGCFEHIACRFPAIARHANPVLHIRPCNPRRNPWLPTNQSICSRARGDNTRGGPRCGAWGRARADFGRTRGTAGVRPLPWKSAR